MNKPMNPAPPPMIELAGITLAQGAFRLEGLDLRVQPGEYAVLMGSTGCGKTTVLEAIGGLRPVAGGTIRIDGEDVTRLPPGSRGLGYVPQDGALFPTFTVRAHLVFATQLRAWPRPRREERAADLAARLGITHLMDRRPQGLSGGERQRVALGRALAASPRVLLLDEPLSALDEEVRGQMCDLLTALHRAENLTVLHVTHSAAEAARVGQRVLKMDRGRIHEAGKGAA